MAAEGLSNSILNSPYAALEEHFELGPDGPTGTIVPGRRPSESFIPVPAVRKGRGKAAQAELVEQTALDFDLTGECGEQNLLINDLRRQVELWRVRNYPGVKPMSRKLLTHWATPSTTAKTTCGSGVMVRGDAVRDLETLWTDHLVSIGRA